jgi:hypothetical protein
MKSVSNNVEFTREVSGSNLDQDVGNPEDFCVCQHPLQSATGTMLQLAYDILQSKYSPVHHSSITLKFDTIWSHSFSASQNKAHIFSTNESNNKMEE